MKKRDIHILSDNVYAKFFLKLLLLLVVVVILDFAIGNILEHYYFKQDSGLQYRTTYSMEKTSEDVLIFGSSRANHHYRPDIFENRLKLSCYNTGRDGGFVFYNYAVLKSVLTRYSPKIVILDVIMGEFRQAKDDISYDRISFLLPYYRSHKEIRGIVELKSKSEKYKLLSRIYPYNSSVLTIAVGNSDFNKVRKQDIKGYIPMQNVWHDKIGYGLSGDYEIDSVKVKCFESFIQDCIKSNIRLYIVCSPDFEIFKKDDTTIRLAKDIAEKYHLSFFDYCNDTLFTSNMSLFDDPGHLNDRGAMVFTNSLIDKIQKREQAPLKRLATSTCPL